jgi:hypothetical protein
LNSAKPPKGGFSMPRPSREPADFLRTS